MTLTFRQLLRDWHVTAVTSLALIVTLTQSWFLLNTIPVSSRPLVLRANIYFGVSQIGSWWELFVPVLAVVLFILANALVSFLVYERHKPLARFVSWFSLSLSLLLGIYTFVISTSKVII